MMETLFFLLRIYTFGPLSNEIVSISLPKVFVVGSSFRHLHLGRTWRRRCRARGPRRAEEGAGCTRHDGNTVAHAGPMVGPSCQLLYYLLAISS